MWKVAISLDGRKVVSAPRPQAAVKIKVWDVKSGNCLLTLSGHENTVTALAFSADGQQFVSASSDYTVRVWNVSSGECLMTQKGHQGVMYSVALSHDGRRVASRSSHTIKVWDSKTESCLLTLEGHRSSIPLPVALSNDGSHVASWSEGKAVKV